MLKVWQVWKMHVISYTIHDMSDSAWKKLITIVNILLFTGAVFLYVSSKNQKVMQVVPLPEPVDPALLQVPAEDHRTVIQNVPFDVTVSTDPLEPKTGQRTTVFFDVTYNGKPVDLLPMGRIMQVSLVSENLRDVEHLFFDSSATPGRYQFDYLFTQAGPYTFYADINHNIMPDHHGDNTDYRSITKVEVAGKSLDGYDAITEPTQVYEKDGYTVTLQPQEILAGELTTLNITVEKNGFPLTFLITDPFYMITAPDKEKYDLEHFHSTQSSNTQLVTQEVEFREPGEYLFWGFIYLDEGTDEVQILQPLFLLDVLDPDGKEQ